MMQPAGGGARGLLRSFLTPTAKQALRNLVGLGICTALSQACSLGVVLLLTRALPPAEFGAVIFALNIQSYLVTLGTFGLASIIIRDLTQDSTKSNETTTAYFCIVGCSSLVTSLIAATLTAFASVSWDERVMLWCIAVGNVAACLNLNPFFDAVHRQALSAVLLLPGDFVAFGLVLVLAETESLTLPRVGVIFASKWTITAALHALFFRRAILPFHWAWDRQRVVRMVKSGLPMMFAGLLSAIPLSGSVVLIRVFWDDQLTATYGLAFQVLAIEILIVIIVLRIIQPHISGPHGLTPQFVRQLMFVLGLTLAALVLVSLAGGWVLFYHVLRPEYQSGFEALAVLQGYLVFCGIAIAQNTYLIRFHNERWVRVQHIVTTSAYLALAFLIGRYFQLGIAVSTAVSSTMLVIVAGLGLRRSWPATETTAEASQQ